MTLHHDQTRASQKSAMTKDATAFRSNRPGSKRGLVRSQIRIRPHLSNEHRTKSELGTVSRSFKIDTILEGKQQTANDNVLNGKVATRTGRQCSSVTSATPGDVLSQSCSDQAESMAETYSYPRASSQSHRSLKAETPPSRAGSEQRPSLSWMRTLSGGILFDRSSSVRDGSSSFQDPCPSHRSTPPAIKPMRPPTLPPSSHLSYSSEHQVRVETPFSDPEETPSEHKYSSKHERVLVRSNFDPREILQPYVKLARKIGRLGAERRSTTPFAVNGKAMPRFHRSGWRRNNVPSVLYRVSSLLTDIKSMRSKERLPYHLARPGVTDLHVHGPFSNTAEGQSLPMERVRSMEFASSLESESSSLVRLRMGPQPPNTPSEQATYRAKRSSSAETEVFLKIDISIRGGTSYLPSEARRVHTPPLPKERPNRKRRGFFFDYNAIHDSLENQNGHALSWECYGNGQAKLALYEKSCEKIPIDLKLFHPSCAPEDCQGQAVDWYGLQLAHLDSMDDGSRVLLRNAPPDSTFSTLQEPQWQYEEKIDTNIPEHLPSSPLCPRHPRYWRIVKGCGSQDRGCWMHGIGLWQTKFVPGTIISSRMPTNDAT